MEINEVIKRLNIHVGSFEKSKSLNDARKAAEAICRIILLNSEVEAIKNKAQQTKLNTLIDSLNSKELSIPENHLKKIKDDLRRIQTYGNTDSHDNDDEITDDELTRVSVAIDNILKYVFDSKEHIYIDQKLPPEIYQKINKSIINDENWRCEKIISIVYPNREKFKVERSKDFEFYALQDADRRKIGILFLGRNISFKNAFEEVFKQKTIAELSSLTFLFPIEISKTTGAAVKKRKENIERISKEFISKYHNLECSYEFIEDYIWDRCLHESAKEISNPPEEPYFIDQKLHSQTKSLLSLDFVDSIVKNKIQEKKPIYIIFGDGGAGKTTFCDQAVHKINQYKLKGHKKKAILLSSFDIPDDIFLTGAKIDSIQSLYTLLSESTEEQINPQSLALNISSGNLLIIIDGLDEIQSKLKERFELAKFIDSVSELNDTYQNCAVLITSREVSKTSFDRDDVSILYIKGFDDNLIEQYLSKRFKGDGKTISRAWENIRAISENGEITPLILRLVCELAADNQSSTTPLGKSNYFIRNQPLDKVVLQLINREIKKQVLGVTSDQYFDILKDIVFEHSGSVKEEELDELIELAQIDSPKKNPGQNHKNFYLSPLLSNTNGSFKIKYDSLELWIKARYLTYLLNEKIEENNINILKAISQDCYKGGALVKEIGKHREQKSQYISNSITKTVKNNIQDDTGITSSKLISALLHIGFENNSIDRTENSKTLLEFFECSEGDRIKGLAIYGEFYPLDFSLFTVFDGYFNGYTALAKSNIPSNKKIFFSSKFINFDRTNFGKKSLTEENFDDCFLCEDIQNVIETSNENIEKSQENAKSDLTKILRVGFNSGSFYWKSEQIYKQQCASLKSKTSLQKILQFLEQEEVIIKETSKSSAGIGYRANERYWLEIRDFVTQELISEKVNSLIEKMSE